METSFMNAAVLFRELLARESDALGELVNMEVEKYDALRMVEVQRLMKINSREEDVLHRIESIEKKRKDVLVNLTGLLGLSSDVSLNEMIEKMPEDDRKLKDEFRNLRTSIKILTEKLQQAMRENSEIIRTNLDIINLTLNFANRNSQKETYDFRHNKQSRENIYLVNQLA